MPTFNVSLRKMVPFSASVTVEADSEDDAYSIAMELAHGERVGEYQPLNDSDWAPGCAEELEEDEGDSIIVDFVEEIPAA